MDVIAGVRSHLLSDSTIGPAVQDSVTGRYRIYTPRVPEKLTLPAINLLMVSDLEPLHLRGRRGLFKTRIQVDAWATTRDGASALGRRIRQRMHGYTGVWSDTSPSSPSESIGVQLIEWELGSDHFEEDIQGGLCRHMSDYCLYYTFLPAEAMTIT